MINWIWWGNVFWKWVVLGYLGAISTVLKTIVTNQRKITDNQKAIMQRLKVVSGELNDWR